jgi:hypothetical protein
VRQRKQPSAAGDNATAAALILADPERHGGEDSLAVRWARLFRAHQSDAGMPGAGELCHRHAIVGDRVAPRDTFDKTETLTFVSEGAR